MAPPRHFNREDDIFSFFFPCDTLTLPPSLFLPFLFLSRLLCPAISPPPPCPPCFKGIVYFERTPPPCLRPLLYAMFSSSVSSSRTPPTREFGRRKLQHKRREQIKESINALQKARPAPQKSSTVDNRTYVCEKTRCVVTKKNVAAQVLKGKDVRRRCK